MTDKLAIEALIGGVKTKYLSGDITKGDYSELLNFMSTAELVKFDELDDDFTVTFTRGHDELLFFIQGKEFDWKWS